MHYAESSTAHLVLKSVSCNSSQTTSLAPFFILFSTFIDSVSHKTDGVIFLSWSEDIVNGEVMSIAKFIWIFNISVKFSRRGLFEYNGFSRIFSLQSKTLTFIIDFLIFD